MTPPRPDPGEPMVPMADVIRVTGYKEGWWRKYAVPWPADATPDRITVNRGDLNVVVDVLTEHPSLLFENESDVLARLRAELDAAS